MKIRPLRTAIFINCAVLALPAYAGSAEGIYEFYVTNQSVDTAINLIAEQSNTPTIFSYEKVRHLQANNLNGHYSLDDALKILLSGTGLVATITAQGVITVTPEKPSETHREETLTAQSKNNLLVGTASVLATIFSPITASAQDGSQNRGSVADLLDEVVVTATKKQDAENVQDIALSVSAFNARTIDALNIQDLQDLTFSAPNASLDGVGSFRGFANFSIRGLGVTSSIPSIDPSVGVFVDGIFLGTNAGVLFDTFDLDSIEILRGPQGLLFGRNTTGGAVVLNTANPTDEFSLKARASIEFPVGNGFGDPAETIQLVTSGPLIKDKLNGKFGVYFENDDGFFVNQFTGESQDAAETLLLRGALEFFPTDNITLLAKLEYMDSDGDGPGITNPGFFERGGFGIATDNPGFQETEAVTFSLRTDIDVAFGNGTITNIFGYRDLEQLANSDIDATIEQVFDVGIFTDQTQISNELRYAGTFGDLEVTTGGFIFQQDLGYDENRTLFGGAVLQAGGGFQDHLVLGGFANFDYNLNEKFVISAGLRYSYEEKEAEISIIGGGGVLADGSFCSVTQGTCATDFEETPDFDGFTPRFAVQYFPTENQQLYANYSRGFRSGVFNFRSTSADPLLFQLETTGSIATEQESLDSFEVGYKFQTTDNRGKFNVAGFYTAIDDLIRDVTVADCLTSAPMSQI